jgi:branched-chain amino acid transport system ATP-binding protein
MIPDDRGLLGGLTVKENLRVAGARRADDEAAALERFPELRTKLKLRAELLSGGEQQMLAIVRAVVRTPRLLLVDELSLGLAPIVVQRLIPSIVDLARSHDCGVLLVEQHVELALSVADRAYVLSHGNLAYSGSAATLLTDPELLQRSYLG